MKNYFSKYKLIVFDLDNTLISEKEYLFKAYEDISYFIEKKCFIDRIKIENYLKNKFIKNGRSKLFDNMFNDFNINDVEMISILNILRTVEPRKKISLIENMKLILEILITNEIPYVIFTNGNVDQQKNKVANIQWEGLQTEVIYANEIKPKPDAISFSTYLEKNKIKINKHEILMIGDSNVDQLFAEKFGCDFKNVSYFTRKDI
jgi:phosphoglycolate phosphatase-like HAD superfamily hydrolase